MKCHVDMDFINSFNYDGGSVKLRACLSSKDPENRVKCAASGIVWQQGIYEKSGGPTNNRLDLGYDLRRKIKSKDITRLKTTHLFSEWSITCSFAEIWYIKNRIYYFFVRLCFRNPENVFLFNAVFFLTVMPVPQLPSINKLYPIVADAFPITL